MPILSSTRTRPERDWGLTWMDNRGSQQASSHQLSGNVGHLPLIQRMDRHVGTGCYGKHHGSIKPPTISGKEIKMFAEREFTFIGLPRLDRFQIRSPPHTWQTQRIDGLFVLKEQC